MEMHFLYWILILCKNRLHFFLLLRHKEKETEGIMSRQTDKQKKRQTGRQPEVKQTETNRKTYRQRDKQTEIGRPKTN